MNKEIKIVIGANYGDEGKGLVSGCLAKKAALENRNILTVFYNGGAQRAHTVGDQAYHCTGAGEHITTCTTTYYNRWYMVDPIALWLERARVYIHPECRVVLPCDVVNNREREMLRKDWKHGSCGMGIFQAARRDLDVEHQYRVRDIVDMSKLYTKLIDIEKAYGYPRDLVYNNDNFLRGCEWIIDNCKVIPNEKQLFDDFDTIIFEGGQGLLLDQKYYQDGRNVHLTPSSPGIRNCLETIGRLKVMPELYYVSRGYLTRHGAGPLPTSCLKDSINSGIIDETNIPNPWQDHLRFGYLNQEELHERILQDSLELCNTLPFEPSVNLVFTQLNYTYGRIAVGDNKREDIIKPDFVKNIWASDQKDEMDILM